MVDVNTFLVMMLYVLGVILLTFSIILVVKLISTVNRINLMIDDVNNKIAKLDKAFNIVDIITDNLAMISDRLVDGVSGLIRKLFHKKS